MASWPVETVSLPILSHFPYNIQTYLWLLALLEELVLTLLLLTLLTSEVLVTGYLIDLSLVKTGKVDLVGSGNNVTSVDSSEWDTVDLKWTGDEEDTLREVLEEDDALATETTSEKDKDGSWGEGGSWSGGSDGLADLDMNVSICLLP